MRFRDSVVVMGSLVASTAIALLGPGCVLIAQGHGLEGFAWLSEVGAALLIDVSWFYPLTVAVLLAFVAVDLGGQLLAAKHTPGAPFVLATAFLVVALTATQTFLVAEAVATPAHAARLIPSSVSALVAFFLAARVGTLLVTDVSARLANQREWLHTLSSIRGRLPVRKSNAHARVMIGTVAWTFGATVIASLVVLAVSRSVHAAIATAVWSGGVGLLTVAAVGASVVMYKIATDRLSRILPVSYSVFLVAWLIAAIAVHASVPPSGSLAVALGASLVILVLALSAAWPRSWSRGVYELTLAGAFIQLGVRIVERRQRKTRATIAGLVSSLPKMEIR